MAKTEKEKLGLRALGAGKATNYVFTSPSKDILETFTKMHKFDFEVVLKTADPFTSLCPITSQPDFGYLEIRYVPTKLCVESKSLKLYLFSYRNFGTFHEAVVCRVAEDLISVLDPKQLTVIGTFLSRGGISINPRVRYSKEKGYIIESNILEEI